MIFYKSTFSTNTFLYFIKISFNFSDYYFRIQTNKRGIFKNVFYFQFSITFVIQIFLLKPRNLLFTIDIFLRLEIKNQKKKKLYYFLFFTSRNLIIFFEFIHLTFQHSRIRLKTFV